jgi:hypothetical protein
MCCLVRIAPAPPPPGHPSDQGAVSSSFSPPPRKYSQLFPQLLQSTERKSGSFFILSGSVAVPGCLSRIQDPKFVHLESQIHGKKKFLDPGFESASKNLSTLTQKICLSRIRILIFCPSRIPDPGVKKAPDPVSGSETLLSGVKCVDSIGTGTVLETESVVASLLGYYA